MQGQSIVDRCGVIVDRCGVVERSLWIRRGVVVGGRGVVVRSLWVVVGSLWSRCGVVVGRFSDQSILMTPPSLRYFCFYWSRDQVQVQFFRRP